ncbi:TPA: hypothetical protein PJA68_001229 [Staphylococcus aureus]|nr:hypothetical protein [Staphylococcus aureus]
MNELQARELETFEQDDRFQVTDLNSANWVFKKLDAITTNILRLAMKKSMTIDFFIAIFYSYREE